MPMITLLGLSLWVVVLFTLGHIVRWIVICSKKKNYLFSSILDEPCSIFWGSRDWVNNAFVGIDDLMSRIIFNNKELLKKIKQQKLSNEITLLLQHRQ